MTSRQITSSAVGTAMLLLAACGGDSGSGAAAPDPIPASATVDGTSPVATEASDTMIVDEECPTEQRTLEVAVEAYFATNGRYPTVEQELVDDGLIRADIAPYGLGPDGAIVRVAGVPCETDDATTLESRPTTLVAVYDAFSEDDIAEIGGPECARELAAIVAAAERHRERTQSGPQALDDFADDLEIPLILRAWDDARMALVPAPGSPCTDLAVTTEEIRQDACRTERKTLEIATEAYVAMHDVAPPGEQALVREGLIRVESDNFDLADGVVSLAPGGMCADVPDAQPVRNTTADGCRTSRRTLEVAVEAHIAEFGQPPTEAALVEAGLLSAETLDYDIADSDSVVIAPLSDCDTLVAESDAQLAAGASQPAADDRACDQGRRTMEVAIEAYIAEFGEPPLIEADLVMSGMLRVESPDFDLGPDGTVVVAPGSICV